MLGQQLNALRFGQRSGCGDGEGTSAFAEKLDLAAPVRCVGADEEGVRSEALCDGFAAAVDVGHDDTPAFGEEIFGQRQADSRGGAGDDGAFGGHAVLGGRSVDEGCI